jgi:hypothetical protein
MRTSIYLIGFAAASLVVGGVVGIGCSSSSSGSPPAPATDAGDDASDDGGAVACVPITDSGLRADTIDGGSSWACNVSVCMAMGNAITNCANDCACNNAILKALACVAAITNPTGAQTTQCFTTPLESLPAGNTNFSPIAKCLQASALSCENIVVDGGLDGATGEDGGTDSSTPATDAGDSGTIVDASDDGG